MSYFFIPNSTPHLLVLFSMQYPLILHDNNGVPMQNYPLSRDLLKEHFVFSLNNWNAKRYHTSLTYSLIHWNGSHFMNNFLSTIIPGSHIIENTSGKTFWFTYFLGSFGGAITSLMEYYYHKGKSKFIDITGGNGGIIDAYIKKPIKQYGNIGIERIFDILNNHTASVGASSSVYGIIGFDLCMTMDKLRRKLNKIRKSFYDENVYVSNTEKISIFYDVFSVVNNIARIVDDFRYVVEEERNRVSMVNHWVVASQDGIAHSAHIGGFIAGVISYLCYRTFNQ